MHISKSRFINWTRCPMYYAMEKEQNPIGINDIDEEFERRGERLAELKEEARSSDNFNIDEEEPDSQPGPELQALLPYYQQVEEEALKVAKKYFRGTFVADAEDVPNQKLFEYEYNGNTYRCYVDIYNENKNDDEINIIEVKATTSSKYMGDYDKDGKMTGFLFSDGKNNRGKNKYPFFVREGNIWHINHTDFTVNDYTKENFNAKNRLLLNRYSKEGKYPYDLAFQRFVIENALRKEGKKRKVNYYLAVLNNKYVYDGAVDTNGRRLYNEVDGQELITFLDMNETTEAYQQTILEDIAKLESYISNPHDIGSNVDVGPHCAWGEKTECAFWKHCFQELRKVPDTNRANNYIGFRGFSEGGIKDKYQLINEGKWKFDDVPIKWLTRKNHKIQRAYYDNGEEWVDKEKMRYWFDQLKDNYPIYHFDFETFPCPLPRFCGENPYRQSVFEFSLHIEREPGVCDKDKDNFIFLNENFEDDEREELVKAIIEHFEFNENGTLKGTMLAQNTSFEKGRLEELAIIFPEYAEKLRAIRNKSADLIHLLKANEDFYKDRFGKDKATIINYYHRDLSGSYSIKKTLPVLVPELTYKGMDVGNGTQAYMAFVNYDSEAPTVFDEGNEPMRTKAERRAALKRYCQQDTWAMVKILRAVRAKI